MATKTEIYELRKKEENDFYNVEDFNNNMDTLEKALTEFDDTGTAEGVTSFPEMLTKLVTGNKIAVTLKNLKAGLQFVLHVGTIVNNCVTDNANLPVSAAMAKSLQDQINQANSNLNFYYRGENPNKDVKTLASGIYQIDGGNEAYTPTRWGMLIVFSAPNYGYALFTHTDGSVYVRTWSQRNGSYYIDWKKLSN